MHNSGKRKQLAVGALLQYVVRRVLNGESGIDVREGVPASSPSSTYPGSGCWVDGDGNAGDPVNCV